MAARWEGRWAKKVKGLRSTNCLLQSSHGDVKYSIGNTVSKNFITMNGIRWVRDLLDGHLLSYAMSNREGVYLYLITMYVNCN